MTIQDFNRCVDDNADGLYRFILKNIRDSEKSQDIVQEAFTRLWEHSTEVEHNKAKSYLFSTAYHLLIDSVRKDKKQVLMEDSHLNQLQHSHQYNDTSEILNNALKTLNNDQRMVLLLRDYEGYSYQEISEITHLSQSQVKVYIFRARKTLKKHLVDIDYII